MKEKINLLIVDDEKRFLETLGRLLERRGFNTTTVSSGEEAIEAAKKKTYDVALVDLRMPGMDGGQVLEELKRSHEDIEVIILTGHGSVDSALNCSRLGGFSYLQKPCEIDTLVHVFNEAYKNRLQKRYQRKIQQLEVVVSTASPTNAIEILERLISLDEEGETQ